MQPGTDTSAPSPQETLTDREHTALTQVPRELGALDRLNEIARDFARRGVHALLELVRAPKSDSTTTTGGLS